VVAKRKDFWTGIIYLAVGVGAAVMAQRYTFGTAARMGPGYFPTVVALLLTLVGAVILGRSFLSEGEAVGHPAWRGMALVLGSIVAFGYLLNRAGFLIAATILLVGSAAASERFRLAWLPLLGMAGLIIFCVLVFAFGLTIPIPLIGEWLGSR